MQDTEIIKIIFGIFLSAFSITLYIIAFTLFYKYLVQEKKCTSKVIGKVKKYTLATRGGEYSPVCLPVVYYDVDGKIYKVIGPEYKGYIIKSISSPTMENKVECHEEKEKLIININKNSIIGILKNPMEELYPVGSKVEVYYSPENPKLSYVIRYCNKKSAFYITSIAATLILIIDILMLIML